MSENPVEPATPADAPEPPAEGTPPPAEPDTAEPGQDAEGGSGGADQVTPPAGEQPDQGGDGEGEADDDHADEHDGPQGRRSSRRRQAQADTAEQQARKLGTALHRYQNDVRKIVGQTAELQPCLVCDGFGFQPAGAEAPPALTMADDAEPCAACNGLGQRITGSHVHGQETKACPECMGNGWKNRAPQNVTPIVQPTATTNPAAPQQFQAPPGYVLVPMGVPTPASV